MTRIYISENGSDKNDGLTKTDAYLLLEASEEAFYRPHGNQRAGRLVKGPSLRLGAKSLGGFV
jgi:hypothetical protein